jgi:ArsR family transcriptional regulator, arsenate/arsenite/antimonite-responsive transcriptional repressor
MTAMDAHLTHTIAPPLAPDILVALQAVAEPTRARIVALLSHGEHCVCDVGEMLGLSPALVSHHLRTLRASGLLRERRSGRWVHYSLDLDRLASLRAAVADLLTPTDAATTACLCSDCGSGGTAVAQPGPLRRLPLLTEAAP